MKPSWWDKDYTDLFNKIFAWLKNDLKYYNPLYAKKKREEELIAQRAAAAKAEWLALDAAQKEFERTGIKKQPEYPPQYFSSWDAVHNEIQRLAKKQRDTWGKSS